MAAERVGPFALSRPLDAEGAPATDARLWLAERVTGDRAPREAVVRKAIDPVDRVVAARITAEYEALRAVDDPRLPRVLGHFAGQGALAMSWAPGPTLAAAATAHRQGALTLDAATVLDVVEEVAQALRHLHGRRLPDGRPLVHGRLDAGRVRLGPTGQVTLLGLGRTGTPADPGSPTSMAEQAPELLAGGRPTARSDQWALGAMLVELLTGTPLYQEPTGTAELSVRREGRVDPWIRPLAQVNPALGRLLERLLAVDPAGRFEDEGELLRSLQALRRSLRGVADRGRLVERMDELGLSPAGLPAASAVPVMAGPGLGGPGLPGPGLGGPGLPGPGLGGPGLGRSSLPAPAPAAVLRLDPRTAADLPEGPLPDPADLDPLAPPPGPGPDAEPFEPEDEVTQPLDGPVGGGADEAETAPVEDTILLPRRPILAPAGLGRLGLGEALAIVAVVLLLVAAIAALIQRI